MAELLERRRSSFARIIHWARAHKLKATGIILVLVGLGYWQFGAGETGSLAARSVIGTVQKGMLITSVTGSGQVSSETQVDVKPKVSGEIVWLGVKEGQYVGQGTILAQVDAATAEKAVRDAEQNLESAQLAYEKLKQSSADIDKILDDAFSHISNAFLDFPTIISNAETIILGSTINPGNQDNVGYYQDFVRYDDTANYEKMTVFLASAKSDYKIAREQYDSAFLAYKGTSRYVGTEAVNELLQTSLFTARSVAQALKSEQNLLDFMTDYATIYKKTLPTIITTYKSNLRTYIGQANGHLSSLVGDDNAIKNAPLDIRSQELTLKQRQNALADAKITLSDYYIRAPFSGILAKLPVRRGDVVGSGTVIATLVTTSQLASISLNEVDVAKAKPGQKATLTFDALPDVTIVGDVVRIDTIGAISQGVVTYTVTIGFDATGHGIKPGMSVSAAIITESRPDVLLIPNAAIKRQGATAYVEMPAQPIGADALSAAAGIDLAGQIVRVDVELGAMNDTMSEVISGVKEGDQIITRTISSSVTPVGTGGTGGIRIPGLGGGR